MKWKFWSNENPNQRKYKNTLCIDMLDHKRTSWTYSDSERIILPCWLPFYKWWFGRESNEFMFRCGNGAVLLRRSEIKSFEIRVTGA